MGKASNAIALMGIFCGDGGNGVAASAFEATVAAARWTKLRRVKVMDGGFRFQAYRFRVRRCMRGIL